MKKFLLSFAILLSICIDAQSYSITKISSNNNGNPGPMKGSPGDLFASTITFSNASSSVIYVVVNRYKNDIPPYWAVCYCYIQCHSPRQDSIAVEIQPFSTTDVTLQFKTDSVNPGIANEGFTIYEIGFQNNSQDLQMTASTLNDVGILEWQSNNNVLLYPNPTTNKLNAELGSEIISEIKIFDITGAVKEKQTQIKSATFTLSTENYTSGIYFMYVRTEKNTYVKRFIKN